MATVVEVGFLLGEPGNSPPYFENDNYITTIPENLDPGTVIMFPEQYTTRVHDEDIGKAGVFALKLQNNNGTFEINPAVAERTADFVITVRDNTLIDYEIYKSLSFKIIAQEVGPATNLSASATVLILIEDVNDNSPVFDEESYEVTLSENVTAGTRVIQVHATDKDTGLFGSIQYTGITGQGNDAFAIDPDTGLITVAMSSSLDREMAAQLQLTVNARDENGKGNLGVAPLIVNILDVNDNAPIFEKSVYEFTLNADLTNFTMPAFIKATDADAEPPNNVIRYELIHGNYENKFYLNEITGELILRSPITKFRRKKQSIYDHFSKKLHKGFQLDQPDQPERVTQEIVTKPTISTDIINSTEHITNDINLKDQVGEIKKHRRKRAETDILYTLTARAYDLGVPHLASETEISIVRGTAMEARIMMFVVPGEHPNLTKTSETLATITGGRVTVLDTRPFMPSNKSGSAIPAEGKRTIVVARVEQTEVGAPLVDVEKIRNTLAANGVGIIGGAGTANVSMAYSDVTTTKSPIDGVIHGGNNAGTYVNKTITNVHEEVTVYKAENKLLFWLLIILGLLMLLAIAVLIICCICPGCPFYMAPRKRRIYSSETTITRFNGRPKRHLHRKPIAAGDIILNGKKQAWSADPTRRNWQFNRRNAKNGGLASLPGDVVYISERPPIDQANVESLRLRDGLTYDPSRRRRIEEQERMYVEDVEERKMRDYADAADAESLQQHEIERDSDILRQAYRQRYVDPDSNNEPAVREQHFYREGNAEVLQLVTRGQVEDTSQRHHYPTTFIVDGKDVLLQRFIQDQKTRHDLSVQESDMRTVESHRRPKNLYQQEILLLPDELEIRHRRGEEMESSAQKLAMDDGYAAQKVDAGSQMRDVHRKEASMDAPGISSMDKPTIAKEQMQSYAFHDLELARQNVLLTRLLLERESRHPAGGVMTDAASYLETQSLPGQVAIATQTDRAAATQTEQHIRSRSDNDESDEDARNRRKTKSKKRYGESELKRTRTLWMKSPIEEEESPCFDKRLNILRKKVKEVKEGRKVPLEPEVLREISDSLDENGSISREREETSAKTCQQSTEGSSIAYKVLGAEKNGSSSSTEIDKQRAKETFDEKRAESLSSPEINADDGKYIRETEKKCSKKESRIKKQKKVESIIKPSFRVLEKEITMLTKKLSKLADKRVQQTTGDESTSQEKSKISKESKKDSDQSTSKKSEDSKKHKRSDTSPGVSKETKREKFKYQQPQVMSPGSSEYEDTLEKPKKSKTEICQEAPKHKQTTSHTRVKKQTQIERKERKKQITRQDRESTKRKDVVSKESKSDSKVEKTAKLLSRTHKLAAIGRREHISEEFSTSTSSDRTNDKKDPFDKRSSESEVLSNHADQQKSKRRFDHVSERFSDDFITESQMEDVDQQSTLRSTGTSTRKEDIVNGKRDVKITQQFTDNFVTQKKDAKYQMQAAESEIEQSAFYDKEHLSLKEAAIITEIKQHIPIDFDKKQSEFSESYNIKESSERKIPVDSPVLKEREIERSPSPKSIITDKIIYTSEKRKEEIEQPKIEEEMLEKEKTVPEKDVYELKKSKNAEQIKGEANILEKESPKELSDAMEHEKHKTNGHSDIIASLLKIEEELKDATHSLRSIEKDKIVELYKTESEKEESSHESKRDSKEEMHLEENMINTEQSVVRKLKRENAIAEDDSLDRIESTVEEKMKITEIDINGHQDIIEKPEETSKEFITEIDLDKDVKSTIETFEESSDSNRSFVILSKDSAANSNGSPHAFTIDDDTLMYIDETSPEEDSTQPESSETIDVAKENTDKDKSESLDDSSAKTEVESHEIEKESPQKISDLEETKMERPDGDKPLAEIATSKESLPEEHEERAKKISSAEERPEGEKNGRERLPEEKERSDDEVREVLDKEPPDLPTDPNQEKSVELDKASKSETTVESTGAAEPQDEGPQQADVSVPIFSSFIDDTLDISEESDSSSDISRKTTLTTSPYDTPRHRQKWQQQDSLEIAGMKIEDGKDASAEAELEDTDSNLSFDEIENIEDSIAIEAAVDEPKKDAEIVAMSEKLSVGDEKVQSDLEKINNEDKEDRDFASLVEKVVESKADVKKDLLTIQDKVFPSAKELNGTPKENVKDQSISVTKEDTENKSESATLRRKTEEVFETVKQIDKSEIRSPSRQTEQVVAQGDKTSIEDTKVEKTRTKDTEMDKTNKDSKTGTPSTSEKHAVKTEASENSVKKKKKLERTRALEDKKHVPDEESKENAASSHSRHRSRKTIDDDIQAKDASQYQPRKQAPFKSRFKKSTVSPKTGEIDVSKTQSKYMAWYNKKREEMERKRLERRAEDEEQLPRWASRSLRQTVRQREKGAEHKTPEMTPRTRRKIKPLVNVESEQLKAIVRQGRRMRKAEGNLQEDPPIEIFARTPPVSTADTQHRLQQHSEYKYEKIPPPFYLHPPPAPHPSPQLSPERSFGEVQPSISQYERIEEDELEAAKNVALQSGTRLRHQQLLEKKSVFDIAYSEAAPSQLRSDSTTPPS
ncbi:uncharacterized protein [Linepithema humile]|uniref:uncharacterized protein n=1 Tax=Linepithema humile TaxID=83485 RepID=UPI00351EA825